MKCRDCPDYKMCSSAYDLRIIRKKCKKAKERKLITNYDRIISKTPEELAKIIGENVECFATCPARRDRCGYSDNCRIAWLDWLKQEAIE